MSPGSILSPTCILIPGLCQRQRIVTCVRETPSVCLRHGSRSGTIVYVHLDNCVPKPQQTAANQTLSTSLCETLILSVSLSWRSFHTGTRRHFLEYTDFVISNWIRQNSPKDRKTYTVYARGEFGANRIDMDMRVLVNPLL